MGHGQQDLLYGGSGTDRLYGGAGADELWGGECVEIGNRDNHFCRATPNGRVTTEAGAAAGDLLNGGVSFDACNGGQQTDCETYRDWRGSGQQKSTAEEWRDDVEAAFTAFGVEEEIEHALQIIACESLGDPFQVTQTGSDYSEYAVGGLFQQMLYYWDGRASAAGVAGAPPFRPDANAMVSAWMVMVDRDAGRDPWHDWTCDEVLIGLGLWE